MMSIWSDFQFALSKVNQQRNVNTDFLLHFVVAVTCFDSNNFMYLAKVKILVIKINQTKEKLRLIFHNESYDTDITTEKMMIKTVRAIAF